MSMDRLREHFQRAKEYEVDFPCWEVKYPHYINWSAEIKPVSILEIGVRHGFSILAMCYGYEPVRLFLIDNALDGVNLATTVPIIQAEFPNLTIDWITGDSQGRALTTEEFDIVHVDGLHTYDGCLNDLTKYGWLARKLIIVDDTADTEVARAVEQYSKTTGLRFETITSHPSGAMLCRL